MGYTDISGLDHDTELATALGNVMVVWARAETSLINVFACITNIHFNFATMGYYRIPTFESRTKVILALLDHWETKDHDPAAIKKAVSKLAKLSRTRNHWVHGVWCKNDDTPETVIFDFRAPETSDDRRKIVRASDIKGHIEAVKKRIADINVLVPHPFEP